MGMNSYVQGIKPPDETFCKMYDAWDACQKAGVEPPKKVTDYFNGEDPDESGVLVGLEPSKKGPVQKYSDENREGFEVDLRKLSPDIKIIRFVNSY
jgi:hypothetical protein